MKNDLETKVEEEIKQDAEPANKKPSAQTQRRTRASSLSARRHAVDIAPIKLLMKSMSKFARRSAAAGVVAWGLLLLARTSDSPETELMHKVVLFGVLVIVPLGLSLLAPLDQPGRDSLFHRLAVIAQPVAAVATVASFFVKTGALAAALASSWLLVNILIALFGVMRFRSRGFYPLEESCIDAGLLYLPVAGVWLVVYRLGIQPFDYGETIILLTAVHFHFAGFAAPIIAGMNGRVLATRRHPQSVFVVSAAGIVVAMPLVAAGITLSPWLALMGTALLSLGLVMLAVLTVGWVIPAIGPRRSQFLLMIGALSSCSAMVLACLYAYSIVTRTLILDIPTMAKTHGLLNAFGFASCNLVAWSLFEMRKCEFRIAEIT